MIAADRGYQRRSPRLASWVACATARRRGSARGRRTSALARSSTTSRVSSRATRTPSASLLDLRRLRATSRATSPPKRHADRCRPQLRAECRPCLVTGLHASHPVARWTPLRSFHFCALSSTTGPRIRRIHVTFGATVSARPSGAELSGREPLRQPGGLTAAGRLERRVGALGRLVGASGRLRELSGLVGARRYSGVELSRRGEAQRGRVS